MAGLTNKPRKKKNQDHQKKNPFETVKVTLCHFESLTNISIGWRHCYGPLLIMLPKWQNFPARSILRYLQSGDEQEKRFSKLTVGTVSGWIDIKSKPRTWRAEVLQRVQKETCWNLCDGRPNLLDQHSEIKEQILQILINIRQSSLPVNRVAAWNIDAIAYLEAELPGRFTSW